MEVGAADFPSLSFRGDAERIEPAIQNRLRETALDSGSRAYQVGFTRLGHSARASGMTIHLVMPGLVPGIHALRAKRQ